ncbi:MAG TPA: PilZ domain-containing protein [bacterium]|nr:PilZ domain-containing protein [bacterium]
MAVKPTRPEGPGPLPALNQRILLFIPRGPFEGSYITKVLERRKDGFRVYAPSFRATILPIPPGESLDVHFSASSAHYEYRCTILERYPGTIPTILISLPEGEVRRVQRRSFFRIGASFPVAIDPSAPIPGTPPPGPPGRGLSVNLSGGGMLVESPELYPDGSLLDVLLEIPDGRVPALVRAEVLRDAGRATPGARGTWFLALEFLSASDGVQERISRYIYRLQRSVRDHPRDRGGATA